MPEIPQNWKIGHLEFLTLSIFPLHTAGLVVYYKLYIILIIYNSNYPFRTFGSTLMSKIPKFQNSK